MIERIKNDPKMSDDDLKEPGQHSLSEASQREQLEHENRSTKPKRAVSLHSGQTIVPREGVAGQALLTVIGIMAFLACLTLGAVFLVRDTANGWQSDIAREITVQIRPFDNVDMEASIRKASAILLSHEGVSKVTALDANETARLLEPFLGSGLQLDELPIPALLTVTIDESRPPDFVSISNQIKTEVPGASLDDHRSWINRLALMAQTTVVGGILVFLLVMTATVLTVVFATRGAMAGNKDIVDVLHFVGADRRFIAREFEHHFLRLGLMGSLAGGFFAICVFLLLGFWSSTMRATPQADQMTALFGSFSIGVGGLLGIFVVAVSVAVLTGLTSRFTVMRHVSMLETYGANQRS
jgi:cell division transport system permease protein